MLILTGCTHKILQSKCIGVDADYVSILQWDGVLYADQTGPDPSPLAKGKAIGTITYSKSEHECPRQGLQDGDATNLAVGTELYEVKGYKTSARLWAGDRLYEASNNPAARTLNDLLDVAGKIQTVRFISGNDGSDLMDFTPEANAVFIREFPKLEYLPFEELSKQTKSWVGDKYWMEIEMKDGSAVRITYNTMFPSFLPSAYATPELAELVEQQRKLIYAQ
ncbi:hypothetical protein HQN87_04565 [Paenibacillus tritici]|uniref:Lipoprotein n=1 Tax=Paenibacillus tritici TaxID=1873425 RepID=A0ABX2DJ06_9BACL|nr:hypothetical protein [Paenibacillus tritici]NQX44595.1 hypothetical protein [Paenibacillus tritici]